MIYRVKKRFYRGFREMEVGDIIDISKEESMNLKGYIEKYGLKNNSNIEYPINDEVISDGVKYKNKMIRKYKRKRK